MAFRSARANVSYRCRRLLPALAIALTALLGPTASAIAAPHSPRHPQTLLLSAVLTQDRSTGPDANHILPLVVAWATQRDFDEMRRCLEGGARAEDAAEFEVWDFAFHHAIVAASRNQLLVAMYAIVERARKGEIWGSLKLRNDSRARRAAYQAEHVRLLDALIARELEEALAATESHLEHVQANLLSATRQRSAD